MSDLYLIRGVPGAGKTTFAAKLAAAIGARHIETDMLRNEWPGGRNAFPWTSENNRRVHTDCLRIAIWNMERGRHVVVSNTFYTIDRMKLYFYWAKVLGVKVTVLHVQGRHGSVHENVDQDMYEDNWEEYKGEYH